MLATYLLFHGLYCSGSMRVSVTLWFGWGGVVSGCRLNHFSLHPVPQDGCINIQNMLSIK